MKQDEKILTGGLVHKLGLYKLDVITSDMLEGYTRIEDYAFYRCNSITSVTIPKYNKRYNVLPIKISSMPDVNKHGKLSLNLQAGEIVVLIIHELL